MNVFSIAQTGITLLLTLAPWFIPDCQWQYKVIFTLAGLLISVAISCVHLSVMLKNSIKIQQEIESRHSALAHQFDEKREMEKRYRRMIVNLNLVFHTALLDGDKVKLKNIYRVFLLEQERLDDGGVSYGKSNQNSENH